METPTPIAGTTTATTSKYIRDFESLFIPIKKDELCDKARNGQLKTANFRSLCWRLFLHCLPEQYDKWLEYCGKSRSNYEKIKAKHLPTKKPEDDQATTTTTNSEQRNYDKLEQTTKTAQDNSYVSNRNKEIEEEQQYLKAINQYNTLHSVIRRDVIRTFPDIEFFKTPEMQGILENVLFNFASENPQLSYKQGMHELLAILLYVLHTDSQNCLINYQGGYANDEISTLLDLKYLEHDVFQLFCALMKSIETWYQNDEILIVQAYSEQPSKNENIFAPRSSGNSGNRQQVSSVLGNKLNMISHNIVKKYDLELFNHLEALQIAPQIYGIRWMRLLFGREFEFLDLLTVWDAIICDPVAAMSLTEYIFASMLVTIREELVNGDYTDCLNNLMRHQFKDVQYVIKLALHLRDPQRNPCPKPLSKQIGVHKASYRRYSPETSLTSKLSQQYISRNKHPMSNKNNHQYEMRVMLSSSKSAAGGGVIHRGHDAKLALGSPVGMPHSKQHPLNVSMDTYVEPLTIEYCWRLLSEQIDSLQKCLANEKGLSSEDEIFMALAQLKKVRDVLKGSLKLDDELDSPPGGSKT